MDEQKSERKTGKLRSRKLWVTLAVAAYFALMAMREQGVDSLIGRVVYGVLAACVVIVYLAIEGRLDDDNIIENGIEDDEEAEG